MKFVLFFQFILFFILFHLCSVDLRQNQFGKEQADFDLLNQDQIGAKDRAIRNVDNSTDNELISLDKEENKIVFDKSDTSPNLNSLFENSTILIDDTQNLKSDSKIDSSNSPANNSTNQSASGLDEFDDLTLDDDSNLDDNSTLDYDKEEHKASLFRIDDDQLLIDGYQMPDNKSFLIDEFVKRLNKDQKLSATVRLICLPKNCDQKILLVTIDRIVLKYELIRQNIFLDKTAKYYNYLNCYLIQYNPNFGLRSYLRNEFSFDFKKAFINECFNTEANTIYGHLYLTNEFKESLKQNNLTNNVLEIRFNSETSEYELSLSKENRLENQVIKNLNGIYKTQSAVRFDQIGLNLTCKDDQKIDDYFNAFSNLLKTKNDKIDDKIKLLTQLNSTLFNDGLHQKLNKFKFLKAQIVFDSGLLTVNEKRNFKILNHLFQIIYESQNQFKQLNIYLVITRFRFKLPNELEILSDTNQKMNVTKLFDHLKNSNPDTYFDLPAEFKLVFLSFKFYYQNTTRLLPSYSDGLIGNPNSPAITIFDFSYLQTNHYLFTYEVAHLLGIYDDNDACNCLTNHCIMKNERAPLNELTWSNCTIKQLNLNSKLYKFDFDLQIDKTEFRADFFNYSICRNGVLERDEQCDCGKFGCYFFNYKTNRYEKNQCCNSTNCEMNDLKFECALGSCCDLSSNCTFYKPDKVCRSSQGNCDIEETCPGDSGFCPVDDFYVNGELCALNSICINKQCIGPSNEFNCKNVLGEQAFESPTCLKKNMVATSLYNCGYSIAERRWISCKSIRETRCGSFQCAINRNLTNSTDSIQHLGKSFELIPTGTSFNRTHECVLLVIQQTDQVSNESNINKYRPFYATDGTSCSSSDDALANIKFCSNGKCVSNSQFQDYLNCYQKSNCTTDQKCTHSNRCRCNLDAKKGEFNFESAFYCPKPRSLFPNPNNKKDESGVFDKLNLYHLLIIPCFAVVLVLASFLKAYLRTGVYKLGDSTSDEMSVSFSGPHPVPFWKPKK